MKDFITGEKRIITYGLFILLGVFLSAAVFYGLEFFKITEENKVRIAENKIQSQKEEIKLQKEKRKKEIFSTLNTEASAYYIFDLEKDIEIFSKNKEKRSGIASLTKIATSAVMIDALKSSLDLEETNIVILKKNLARSGDNGLKWGEKFDWKSLLKFMMIASSNDAASAMTNKEGENAIIEKMNILAENLKMDKTFFFSESGLDINENILGAYATAEDIAKLVKYFYKKYPEFSKDFSVPHAQICSEKICHNAENTNKLLLEGQFCTEFSQDEKKECLKTENKKFPYDVFFSKTGYTKKSGASVVMISEILGHKILTVVLGSGKESRFSDTEKIVKKVEEFLKK